MRARRCAKRGTALYRLRYRADRRFHARGCRGAGGRRPSSRNTRPQVGSERNPPRQRPSPRAQIRSTTLRAARSSTSRDLTSPTAREPAATQGAITGADSHSHNAPQKTRADPTVAHITHASISCVGTGRGRFMALCPVFQSKPPWNWLVGPTSPIMSSTRLIMLPAACNSRKSVSVAMNPGRGANWRPIPAAVEALHCRYGHVVCSSAKRDGCLDVIFYHHRTNVRPVKIVEKGSFIEGDRPPPRGGLPLGVVLGVTISVLVGLLLGGLTAYNCIARSAGNSLPARICLAESLAPLAAEIERASSLVEIEKHLSSSARAEIARGHSDFNLIARRNRRPTDSVGPLRYHFLSAAEFTPRRGPRAVNLSRKRDGGVLTAWQSDSEFITEMTNRRHAAWLDIGVAVLAIIIVVQLTIHLLVTRPLNHLLTSIHKVEMGYPAKLRQGDIARELRWLAWRFHHMSSSLTNGARLLVAAHRRAMEASKSLPTSDVDPQLLDPLELNRPGQPTDQEIFPALPPQPLRASRGVSLQKIHVRGRLPSRSGSKMPSRRKSSVKWSSEPGPRTRLSRCSTRAPSDESPATSKQWSTPAQNGARQPKTTSNPRLPPTAYHLSRFNAVRSTQPECGEKCRRKT